MTGRRPMRSLLCFLAIITLAGGVDMAQTPAPGQTPSKTAAKPEPGRAWPHPIPARIRDGSNKDMFVMTLGNVSTEIADGIYDPSKDEVTLKDGSVLKNYYRDTLRVKFFKPIDKSIFPLPPSGLCTWYYY